LPGDTEETLISVGTVGLRAMIGTQDLPNKKKRYTRSAYLVIKNKTIGTTELAMPTYV
jgi:hypothetical protein